MWNKIFPIIIIVLFFLASAAEGIVEKNIWKSLFYLFSGLLNVVTVML